MFADEAVENIQHTYRDMHVSVNIREIVYRVCASSIFQAVAQSADDSEKTQFIKLNKILLVPLTE